MQNGIGTAAPAGSSPSDFDQIKSAAEGHIGCHPALDNAIDSLLVLATVQADGDTSSAILAGVAGDCSGDGTLLNLIGHIIKHLGDPASNRALTVDVPADRLRRIQEATAEFTEYAQTYLPHELVNESIWDLSPTAL
ncbi:hypothetical protein OG693_39585 (plasmid) [Streptomyces sp. NBC_01259]|uniref:hypothetical protein n=1 Tax=Streptomyces sp. NBC_01259 TaxID=2903800 RepID=UPI002F907960